MMDSVLTGDTIPLRAAENRLTSDAGECVICFEDMAKGRV